jgi:hypothetical protein
VRTRAGQYWRLENLKSFDEFLEQRFPESRRKAHCLMSIHEHLPRQARKDLKEVGWTKDEAGHQRRYNRRALRDLLLNVGFSVDFLTGFFQFLPPVIFAARVLPYRLGLAKSPDASEVSRPMKQQHVPKSRMVSEVLRWLQQRATAQMCTRRETRHGASWLVVATKLQD